MFMTQNVNTWTATIEGLDMPNYYMSFAGIVCTVLTLTLEDAAVDNIIVRLADAFNFPPEEYEFLTTI